MLNVTAVVFLTINNNIAFDISQSSHGGADSGAAAGMGEPPLPLNSLLEPPVPQISQKSAMIAVVK